jgi:hypothetical protein
MARRLGSCDSAARSAVATLLCARAASPKHPGGRTSTQAGLLPTTTSGMTALFDLLAALAATEVVWLAVT